MSDATLPTRAAPRPPLWRDVRVLRVVAQVAVVVAVALLLWFLWDNLTDNLRRQGIRTDLGFLDQATRFAIPDVTGSASFPFWRAMLTGVKNTALIGFVGIFLTTLLGVLVGVMRLSANWLVRRVAGIYVEALRNTPVLILILILFLAVVLRLPGNVSDAPTWGGTAVVSNRGIWVPWLEGEPGRAGWYWLVVAAALAATVAVAIWRTRRFELIGTPHQRFRWGAATFLAVLVVGYLALGAPFGLSLPERTTFGASGGIKLDTAYAALLVALVIYTASHIAEIVRGSILAVPGGQTEAARAVGLTEFQRMRYVVLPQAFRIMVPPLGNQYLNLVKNSSLAVAIGFYDMTRIAFIASSQGFPAPQVIAILMLLYLAFSLSISAVTNAVNRRLQLATR
ncbi:MAG TPA: ABC transporter permease subunit [Nitriliruptorales bacterium]|nr:ABC transporter permease subunit [Nitriliruptorales bacterium]